MKGAYVATVKFENVQESGGVAEVESAPMATSALASQWSDKVCSDMPGSPRVESIRHNGYVEPVVFDSCWITGR